MESEASQQFCLRWHNHQSSVLGGLPALLDSGRLTDVTLCAGGRSLRAHRIVLSTCSPYFMDIFKDLPATQQPVVVILGGGWAELCCLVAFMYAGEVTLPRTLLPGLLRLARALRITGLTDLNGNIPDVPLQPEFDESFNAKFESTFSNFEEMKVTRQNSDSTSCAESVSPYHKPFDIQSTSKKGDASSQNMPDQNVSMFDNIFQELQLLKQLSKSCLDDKNNNVKEEMLESDGNGAFTSLPGVMTRGKKSTKIGKSNKYMNPVLNEIEPKNRKIDKIVENLKCNQMRTQEVNLPSIPDASNINEGDNFINPKLNLQEKSLLGQKINTSDLSIPSCSKVADIFASNNIFMETDTEPIESSTETVLKSESDSSPEIISDMKYAPLSPNIQSLGMHTPTNTKLYATCYVCHKRLSNQYNLRVHLETHQNARHACIACNHVSRSRDALRKHVSYRHPQLSTSHGVGRPCKSNQNTQHTTSTTSPNIQQPLQNVQQNLMNITPNVFNFPNIGNINDTFNSNTNKNNKSNTNIYGNLDQSNSSQGSGSGTGPSNKSDDAKKNAMEQNF